MNQIILLTIISFEAFSFTLVGNAIATFGSPEITVNVGNSQCPDAVDTPDEILEMVGEAIDQYWNVIPTSSLLLKKGSLVSVDSGFYTDQICTSSNEDCTTPIPTVESGILVVCNDNSSSEGFNQQSILAVALPNNVSSSTINGSVVAFNARSGSSFSTQSRESKIAILAHEIGHAFGLGHSEFTDSLMFAQNYTDRTYLGQDDYDGATFLYPKEQGAGALCGAIIRSDNNDKGSLIKAMMTLFLLFMSANFYIKRKLSA